MLSAGVKVELERASWLIKSWNVIAAVVRQVLTFVEQAWLGLRLFGGVEVLGVFDVVAGEVQAALESLVERWTVKDDMEADKWMGVERRKGSRLLTIGCAVSIAGPGCSAPRSCEAIADEAI